MTVYYLDQDDDGNTIAIPAREYEEVDPAEYSDEYIQGSGDEEEDEDDE